MIVDVDDFSWSSRFSIELLTTPVISYEKGNAIIVVATKNEWHSVNKSNKKE